MPSLQLVTCESALTELADLDRDKLFGECEL